MSSVQVNFQQQDVSTKVPEAVKFKSKLSGVGGLILGRQTLRFDPQNQNAYTLTKSGGAGTASFRMACNDMMDLSTLTLNYSAQGTQTTAATATTSICADDGGLNWWKQATLWVNGTVVESITDVGVAQNILTKATMPLHYISGSGVLAEGTWRGSQTLAVARSKWATVGPNQCPIKNQYSVPLSVFGITKLKSYFPSRFIGELRIDLVFENSLSSCIVDTSAAAVQSAGYKVDFSDINITCDTVQMAGQYYQMLGEVLQSGSGWTASVPTLNMMTTTAANGAGQHTFTLSEAREDVLSIFIVQRPQADIGAAGKFSKSDFYANTFVDCQLVIRGQTRPVQPVSGYTQAYQEFRKAVGTFNSPIGSSAITPTSWYQVAPYAPSGTYGTDPYSFILGFNLESVLADDLEVGNGVSTRESSGSIYLKMNNTLPDDGAGGAATTEIMSATLYHVLLKFQSGQVNVVS